MAFPGFPNRGFDAQGNSTDGMSPQEAAMLRGMQGAMESCVGKTILSGVMGFALGGAFGLFMSSMSYDTPLSAAGQEMSKLSTREQLRRGFKDMGAKSFRSAKNFGIVGAVFAGTECCFEGLRAKNDMKNGIAAGCVTGGILGLSAGPQAAGVGCVGFAAFSAAIEYYMRMPSD